MKDVRACDVMATTVHHVSPELCLIDLENELSSQRISGAPVVEKGRVVGIVSRSDIDKVLSSERSKAAAAAAFYHEPDRPEGDEPGPLLDPTGSALEGLRKKSVRDIMTRDVISVSGEEPIARVADLMRRKRIHRVLVIEEGKLLGLISSLDIVAVVADRA